MPKPVFSWLAIAAIAAGLAMIATAEARPRPRASYTIVIDKMAFGPSPSGLHVGDTITWVNHDLFRHTATAADRSFNLDLPSGKSGQVTLKRAGAVVFSCTFHPGMRGALVVLP
jgi:plastocyanin